MTSTALQCTWNPALVKSRGQEKSHPSALDDPAADTFRITDRNLPSFLIAAKYRLALCGAECSHSGCVVFVFEDVHNEGVRLAQRWAEAGRRLRRAARVARERESTRQR